MVVLRLSLAELSTNGRDRRFGTRLPIRLPVEVQLGRTLHSLYTHDVGLEGMFLTMAKPPARHHLVHVTLDLPPFAEKVRFRAMVVGTVTPVEAVIHGQPPGMDLLVYGSSESTHRLWYRFIERSQTEIAKACEIYTLPQGRVRNPSLTPSKQTHVVHRADQPTPKEVSLPPFLYRISPATYAELARFHYKALLQEGIVFVDLPPGTDNALAVVAVAHPDTGAEFHVPCKVVRGIALSTSTVVHFLGISKRTIEGFEHFIQHGTPPPFDNDSASASEEVALYEDAQETPGNMGSDPPRFAEVGNFRAIAPTDSMIWR